MTIDASSIVRAWPKSGAWSIAPADVSWCRLGDGVLWAAHLGYDPRGYAIAIGRRKDGELRIYAGCRDLSIAAARAHWGDAYDGVRINGRHILAAIDYGVALAAIHSPEAT